MIRQVVFEDLPDDWSPNESGIETVESLSTSDGIDPSGEFITADWLTDEGGVQHAGGTGRDAPEPDPHTGSRTRTDQEDSGAGIVTDPDINGDPIAVHDSGAQLFASVFGGTWLIDVVQPIESDGVRAYVSTHNTAVPDEDGVAAFITDVTTAISEGREDFTGIAVVGHDSTTEGITLEHINTDGASLIDDDGSLITPLADVFAVRTDMLPDSVSVEDLHDCREELAAFVYGLERSAPDALVELGESQRDEIDSNNDEPDPEIPIEMFSVTADAIEPVSSE